MKTFPSGNCTGNHAILPTSPVVLRVGHSLSIPSVVARPALVVLMMIARYPSAITIRNLCGKKKVYYFRTRKLYNTQGPRSEVSGREGEPKCGRVGSQAWGSAFIGVKGAGLGFYELTLYC